MRKYLIFRLTQKYLRTFPPINKNGNGMIANLHRDILAAIMLIIGGGNDNTERLIEEIVIEYDMTCK